MAGHDTRWNNPRHVPLSNGPYRLAKPAVPPQVKLGDDGQVIEYLLPYPMHIIDEAEWEPITCILRERTIKIQKPILAAGSYEPEGRFSNETPEVFCTIIHAFSPGDSPDDMLAPGDIWPTMESLLTWIRVKARHYWLLHGLAGFGALYRGSISIQHAGEIQQGNFVSYGPNVIVRPLTRELWDAIGVELRSGFAPPVSESIFCDALLSLVGGDKLKAVLELGVAAEVEVTNLLDDIANTSPDSPGKRQYLEKEGDWDKFDKKLTSWAEKLGLQRAEDFGGPGIPKDWTREIKELYGFRGKAAHGGKLEGVTDENISGYLFACNALFRYCRVQRQNAGLPVYLLPNTEQSLLPIVAFVGGRMVGLSSMSSARVA